MLCACQLKTLNVQPAANYNVIDLFLNLSDHRPVVIRCNCVVAKDRCCSCSNANSDINKCKTSFLRWDRANLAYYRELTRVQLAPIWRDLCGIDTFLDADMIDAFYNTVVDMLQACSAESVPRHRRSFFKFWWDQEMNEFNELKEKSIVSCKLWKEAGKPRSGSIFYWYRCDKCAYRNGLRRKQRLETEIYTNYLHDALLQKQGIAFGTAAVQI